MTTYDIALIGFGGVNRTLAELVATRGETLRSDLGFGLRVVAITDLRLGSLVQPEGIDLSMALNLDGGSETSPRTADPRTPRTNQSSVLHRRHHLRGHVYQPRRRRACRVPRTMGARSRQERMHHEQGPGCSPRCRADVDGQQNGVHFEFEGAVMSGTPVIRLAKKCSLGSAERLRRHPQRHQQYVSGG